MRRLFARQYVGNHALYSDLARYGVRRAPIIAGQHRHLKPVSLQACHGFARFGAYRIGERDYAQRIAVRGDEHGCAAAFR